MGRRALGRAIGWTFLVALVGGCAKQGSTPRASRIDVSVTLPTAETAEPVSAGSPRLTIVGTRTAVGWDDMGDLGGDGFKALVGRLKSERVAGTVKESHGDDSSSHALLLADPATDFSVVRKVLFALDISGWTRVDLAVSKDGTTLGVPLDWVDRSDPVWAQALTVHVSSTELALGHPPDMTSTAPHLGPRSPDWMRLEAMLASERMQQGGKDQRVIIAVDDGVPYADMVAAVDHARSVGFTHTLIGGGPSHFADPLIAATSGEGRLDASALATAVTSKQQDISDCYAGALERRPGIQGTLTVRFAIAADGSVGEVKVASDALHDPTLDECMVGVVHGFRFPPPDGGAMSVTYPFTFSPAK